MSLGGDPDRSAGKTASLGQGSEEPVSLEDSVKRH